MILGQISLNISFIIYTIWFIPQLYLNLKRKNTEGLSIWMHGILCTGYLADLVYGLGTHMQWQYRMVTYIGLVSLALQHYQFFKYGVHEHTKDFIQKRVFLGLSFFYLLILGVVVFLLFSKQSRPLYDWTGMVANACWLSYMLPQIIKNYRARSTVGLSPYFVCLSVFLNICDSTSAWSLGWDYPSKIGPCVALIGNLILIVQVYASK